MPRKRIYNSDTRQAQAEQNRARILTSAKRLFSKKGFEKTAISDIAALAEVSAPLIYALFKSKEGLLRELMHSILFGTRYKGLVENAMTQKDPVECLKMAAKISRSIYDSDKMEMEFLRGASVLSPALKKLEKEAEALRYQRQESTVKRLLDESVLRAGLGFDSARDVLWTLTSRDVYHMLVGERGWSSDDYEIWLADMLNKALCCSK